MSVAQPHDDSGTDSPTMLYLVGRADRVVRRAMNEVLAAHGVSLDAVFGRGAVSAPLAIAALSSSGAATPRRATTRRSMRASGFGR